MAVIEAKDETFMESVKEGVSLIDFYSTHCGPCRALLPTLLEIEGELPFINLVKVNTDYCTDTADRYRVDALPTLMLAKDGVITPYEGERDGDSIREALGALLYD